MRSIEWCHFYYSSCVECVMRHATASSFAAVKLCEWTGVDNIRHYLALTAWTQVSFRVFVQALHWP